MTDSEVIDKYIVLGEFISKCLGDNVEVVVHNFCAGLNQSAVAVFNGHISGRSVGAPMTPTGLAFLRDEKVTKQDYIANYYGSTVEGRPVRSSTFFIRNRRNKIIGTLCVNVDISQYMTVNRILDKLIYAEQPGGNINTDYPSYLNESFPRTLDEHIDQTIADYEIQSGHSLSEFSVTDNVAVIEELQKQGLFSIKGSVKVVASVLKISQPSVYRYLEKINQNKSSVGAEKL